MEEGEVVVRGEEVLRLRLGDVLVLHLGRRGA